MPFPIPVLVYITNSKCCEVPFRLISIEGETEVIQLPRDSRISRNNFFKPWFPSTLSEKFEPGAKYESIGTAGD